MRIRIPVCLLTAISGASALVYQVTWVRDLSLVFGAAFQAASVTLASFMCGLALGSFAFGQRASHLSRTTRMDSDNTQPR